MSVKGTDVMLFGSFILVFIVTNVPHEKLLHVSIPFIIIELIIAMYIIIKNGE